jgi:HMG (high mobility group) box
MIFRSELWHKQKNNANAERDHRNISVVAGLCWSKLTADERKQYELRAERAKERHAAENPEYKYTPTVRKKPVKRRSRKDPEIERERCLKLASEWMKHLKSSDTIHKPLTPPPALPSSQSTSSAHSSPIAPPINPSTNVGIPPFDFSPIIPSFQPFDFSANQNFISGPFVDIAPPAYYPPVNQPESSTFFSSSYPIMTNDNAFTAEIGYASAPADFLAPLYQQPVYEDDIWFLGIQSNYTTSITEPSEFDLAAWVNTY